MEEKKWRQTAKPLQELNFHAFRIGYWNNPQDAPLFCLSLDPTQIHFNFFQIRRGQTTLYDLYRPSVFCHDLYFWVDSNCFRTFWGSTPQKLDACIKKIRDSRGIASQIMKQSTCEKEVAYPYLENASGVRPWLLQCCRWFITIPILCNPSPRMNDPLSVTYTDRGGKHIS